MRMLVTTVTAVMGAAVIAGPLADAQPSSQNLPAWRTCCGVTPWAQGPGMMGGGMMGYQGGSMARHHIAMMGGVPAPYANAANPLPRTAATIEHGAGVYAANCASCHGATGLGDGAAAQGLTPRPANLAWLSNMRMSQWDPFMYWTVAEGGKQFGSAMPAFKDKLSKQDIWAAIAYVQANLPQSKAAR